MRWEVVIRNPRKNRKHEKTVYVEAEGVEEILESLHDVRQPVLLDIALNLQARRKMKEIEALKKTDFFDAKGKDISYEEYYENEISMVRRT